MIISILEFLLNQFQNIISKLIQQNLRDVSLLKYLLELIQNNYTYIECRMVCSFFYVLQNWKFQKYFCFFCKNVNVNIRDFQTDNHKKNLKKKSLLLWNRRAQM